MSTLGMQLLSQYLDNTGDIQSVALLVSCNTILQKQVKRVEGWIET